MTGLEKILAQIQGEAQAAAEAKLRAAQAKAEEECAAIAARADEECRQIEAKSRQQCTAALQRAASAAQLQQRRKVLETKQQIIAEAMQAALQKMRQMPTEEYFAALRTLAVRYAQPGEGVMYFGEKDLARLPEGYEKTLNEALGSQRSVKISREKRPIADGFVLAYGGIEENCSLQALFAADREAMQDLAQSILFAAE